MPDTPSPFPPFPPFTDAPAGPALPSSAPCPLPGEDALELDRLRRAVANDWGPRDAYERHWAGELVAAMRRQDRLRGLELATLDAAAAESPPTEATLQRLLGFARYGARIDRDLGAALRALRVLRNRPDAWIEETSKSTSEPERPAARTREPEPSAPVRHTHEVRRRPEPGPTAAARTSEPDEQAPSRTREPEPTAPPLNRHERRRLEALQRQAERRAA